MIYQGLTWKSLAEQTPRYWDNALTPLSLQSLCPKCILYLPISTLIMRFKMISVTAAAVGGILFLVYGSAGWSRGVYSLLFQITHGLSGPVGNGRKSIVMQTVEKN